MGVPPALPGLHQVDNAATVLAALSCMQARLPVRREHIERGLLEAFTPGRFQRVRALDRNWILDVAHNPHAARYLAERLVSLPSVDTAALFAVMADKDVDGMIAPLRQRFTQWFAANLPDNPRALPAAQLVQRLIAHDISVSASGGVEELLPTALAGIPAGGRLVIFGSFFTVAAALRWLNAEGGERD